MNFFTPWNHDNVVMTKVHKRLFEDFEPLARNINLQLNSFEKSLVKEMKDDLKYVLSLEDEFDEKFLILDIQTEFLKTQFDSTISESYSHVYENDMFEQNSSLESKNCCLKKTVSQFQKDFSKLEAHCINLEVQLQNNVLKSGQHGQILKETSNEFASYVDTNNDFPKPVTPYYWTNVRAPAFAKPYHMIVSSETRNISKNMPRFSSNDMVHNHYLEEAKKKTQERDKNSKTRVMPSTRLQNAANGSKPNPRSMNQITRNWPTHKSSYLTKTAMPKAEHPTDSSSFLDSKCFVCSTCQKCVFNANHDTCITNLLKEVNSWGKKQSHKTTKRYMPVEKKSNSKKHERHIPIGQKFYSNKSSAVWIPIGKTVGTCLNSNDSAIPLGKETCSPKSVIYANSSSLSADEAPDMIIDFINQVQRNLKAQILMIQTDNGTEFKNKKLRAFYAKLGIVHKTSIARTPQQKGVVERRNQTLVEAARTMLIFSKTLEFLWAEVIATACFTQNRSIIHTRYNKTPYELIRGRKPNIQYFHVFGSLCYPTNDRDDLEKMKPKADFGIFIGYSKSSRGFRIYNR
ncbi:retrovirus-related pol polyprotein from transposon TNT 1-94 [Tanacetum coccineum]